MSGINRPASLPPELDEALHRIRNRGAVVRAVLDDLRKGYRVGNDELGDALVALDSMLELVDLLSPSPPASER